MTPDIEPRPACAGAPTPILFPETSGKAEANYAQGLALCAGCGYHDQCRLRWIESDRPEHGVWFGTTPKDRRRGNLGRGHVTLRCVHCSTALTDEQRRERRSYCGPSCAEQARRRQQEAHEQAVNVHWGARIGGKG